MPVSEIVQLIIALAPLEHDGITLIGQLIKKTETKGSVSSVEWADVETKSAQRASDRMALQLKAAGVDPASPEGIALLAATK